MDCIIGKDSSTLPLELIKAYCETEYRADAGEALVLRIGQRNIALATLYQAESCKSAAFITACNPWSQEIGAEQNIERQRHLAEDLTSEQRRFWSGEGAHPSGSWTPEPSYLVVGLTLDEASDLGREWEQNAVVWCDEHALPWLVLLR